MNQQLVSKPSKFGIQLWSVKEEMTKDPKGTIEKLASFGYTQIETFEGEMGMCWGMKPQEFKSFLNDLGLDLIAGHCNIVEDFERKLDEAHQSGMKYVVCPWLGPQESPDKYKAAVDLFNTCGEKAHHAGLGFAYHNHDYSFKSIDGIVPQQMFMESTNPAWVSFEMDIYWVVMAGEDPKSWLTKYTGRWPSVHVKDKANLITDDKFISIELGKGTINYPSILDTCLKHNVDFFMVEQERFDTLSPLQAAKSNASFMMEL